jgi:hypothetical protein
MIDLDLGKDWSGLCVLGYFWFWTLGFISNRLRRFILSGVEERGWNFVNHYEMSMVIAKKFNF